MLELIYENAGYLMAIAVIGIAAATISYVQSRPKKALVPTIDWTPEHNLVIKKGPLYTEHKRGELIEDIDTLTAERNDLRQELTLAEKDIERLHAMLQKQITLKKRYWRVLRREGLR